MSDLYASAQEMVDNRVEDTYLTGDQSYLANAERHSGFTPGATGEGLPLFLPAGADGHTPGQPVGWFAPSEDAEARLDAAGTAGVGYSVDYLEQVTADNPKGTRTFTAEEVDAVRFHEAAGLAFEAAMTTSGVSVWVAEV